MNKDADQQLIKAALEWYQGAGVDVIASDQPTDWFKASKKAEPVRTPAPPRPTARQRQAPRRAPKQVQADHRLAAPSTVDAVMTAQKLAGAAKNLEELHAALTRFDGCALKQMAKNTCFADGNREARVMLVGEAPGRDEDLAAKPFVGRAGQLLDKMLQATGWQRDEDVWITNTVYWRPPGNRTPSQQETEICCPFLERQIELIKPCIIVALGGAAAKQLLNTTSGIMRLRGRFHEVEIAGGMRAVFPTLHPAYLLRTPAAKRLAWRDLLTIRDKLEQG